MEIEVDADEGCYRPLPLSTTKPVEGLRQRPNTLRIGPRVYRIYWDHESWADGMGAPEDKDDWGNSSHRYLNIYICPTSAPWQKADTLLHEIMHCCFNLTGDLKNYLSLNDVEEHIVTAVTPHMLTVINQNPDIIHFLKEPW